MFIYNSGQQESFYEMQNKINRKLRSLRRLGLGLAAANCAAALSAIDCSVD